MSRSYSTHSVYTMTMLCENKFSQLHWLAFSCLCCSNWRDTRRLSLHEELRWKHSRDKMRKLKKELVWGIIGRCNMCACNATFHSALEVCLNCGRDTNLCSSMCCQEKGEHACVALKGDAAFYGGVGSFNGIIHLVLSL